ncbi:MAG: DUF2809 domain-containing protein [Ignavibacteria bacterium]|nr:DUF2809 domain-containing protein [Ignavibacteria bacterium]
MKRNRLLYFLIFTFVIICGLLSRKYSFIFPVIVNDYLGDSLWAAMVFFMFAFVFNKMSTIKVAFIALAFSYCIEISQLYHAPWIESIRNTTLGGLVLGFGFLWSDIFAYTLGVSAAALLEYFFSEKE